MSWKQPARVATTANITIATALNAGDTIDGVTLATWDRVLVKDQSTASQNGVYVVGASPVRAHDMDLNAEVPGAVVYVIDGTTNGGTLWRATNTTFPTIGSTAITFTEFSGAADAILRYGGAAEWLDAHGGAAVGATETINLANGNVHAIILDVNCTLTFSGAVATIGAQDVASSFTLIVVQDGSGGNTITWPGSVEWPDGSAPTLDTTGGAVEILTFLTPDGGTIWYGFHGGTGGATALDDLTDVTITSPVAGHRLRFNGSVWLNTSLVWHPVMAFDPDLDIWLVVVDGDGTAVMAEG